MSSSPKKNRKNGSSTIRERTTCVDEMLVTLSMARCATEVRSGSAAAAGAAGAGPRVAACGAGPDCAGAAVVTSAERMRPVSTSPPTNPTLRKVRKTRSRFFMAIGAARPLTDFDLARGQRRQLGNGDGQHPVGKIGRDLILVDAFGELERAAKRAVAPFDLVIVHGAGAAGARFACSLDRQARVDDRELHLLARGPGHFGGDHVRRVGLVDVDRRGPGLVAVVGQAV